MKTSPIRNSYYTDNSIDIMKKQLMLIGDVHGKYHKYQELIQIAEDKNINSIQLGDFGFELEHIWHRNNIDCDNHKILFGNHDFYPFIDLPHSLGNFGYLEEYGIFYIRGANSIDKYRRTPGLNWFDNEELSWEEANQCLDLYETIKPNIVISHDCPFFAYEHFNIKSTIKNHTSVLLSEIHNTHQPQNWYFGHHHISTNFMYMNTNFRCLAELEYTII